jgi:hypothetical protein
MLDVAVTGGARAGTYDYVGKNTTSNNWTVASSWTNGSDVFPNAPGDIVRPLSHTTARVNLYLNTNITIGGLEWSGSEVLLLPGIPAGKLTNDNLGTPSVWRIAVSNRFYLDPDLILKDDLTLSISNNKGFVSERFDALRIVGQVSGPGKLTLDTPVPLLNTYAIGYEGGAANTYSGGTRLTGHPSGGAIYEPRKYKAFGTGDVEVGPGARLYLRNRGGTLDYVGNSCGLWLESQTMTNRANVHLESGVNETVARLYLDGVQQPAGTYGATGSPAAENLDEFLTGPGILTVTSGPPSPGAIRNLPATGVAWPQATLRGEVLGANASPTFVFVYWGRTDGGRNRAAWENEAFVGEAGVGEFLATIDFGGAPAGDTFFYSCYLTNSLGGKWASATAILGPPVVRNELPVVRTNQVTLRGSLLVTNGQPTSVMVYWGTNDGGTVPANWQNAIPLSGFTAGLFATNIFGLSSNTTCYYRCFASNSVGPAWATNSQSFTTFGPPASGEIVFLVGSDPHYGFTYHVPTCTERAGSTLDNMNLIPGVTLPASVGGGALGMPRGLLIVGDLTEVNSLAQWMAFTNDFGLNGERRLAFPVFEGYGNHEGAVAYEGIKARNPLRTGGANLSISPNGYHYSWDWDFLHVVCLNAFPGNETDPGYLTIDPRASLNFIASDLAANVGGSGRPVVIYHHYGLDANSGLPSWSDRQRTNYFNVLSNYNVIAIFSGHSHLREFTRWRGINTFTDGTMGKFTGNFLAVRVTRTNLTVVERSPTNTWAYAFRTNITVPPPLAVSNGEGATEITYSSARLNGALPQFTAPPTGVSIYWGPTDGGTNVAAWANVASVVPPPASLFSAVVTGLTWDTPYYYRCRVDNGSYYVWAPVSASFQTLPLSTNLFFTTNVALVSTGAVWRYHDAEVDLGSAWRESGYDDSAWSQGAAPLGYGNSRENTVVGAGNAPPTVYYRHAFVTPNTLIPISLAGSLQRDDGTVVYLNGTEIFRDNLPAGAVSYSTPALSAVDDPDESDRFTFVIPENLLLPGTNVLAAEMHQCPGELGQPVQSAINWSFDETGSPWGDRAGANHFVALGTNLVAVTGKFGGGVSNRMSATDYLIAADSPHLSYSAPFTVGGWFSWAWGASESICLQKPGEFKLSYSGTTLNRYRFEVNGSVVQDQTCCTTNGQWRFVVGWYDGTNACIQVDNGPVYTAPAAAPPDTTKALIALKKGYAEGGIAADEVFFSKRVLSASERAALYGNQSIATNAADLFFDLALTGHMTPWPVFRSQPASLVRRAGEDASFLATATSPTPAIFQWVRNDAPLPGATNELLSLGPVSPADVGVYVLVVSNPSGVAVSSPATLSVIAPPRLSGYKRSDSPGFTLEVPPHGVPVIVEVSTNLTEWTTLFSLPALFTPTNVLDTSSPGIPVRFYRLQINP